MCYVLYEFVCFDALCPNQQFLVMLGWFPVLLGSNQNYVADKVSCSMAQQGDIGTHLFLFFFLEKI